MVLISFIKSYGLLKARLSLKIFIQIQSESFSFKIVHFKSPSLIVMKFIASHNILYSKGYWLFWLFITSIIAGINLTTMSVAPYLHSDEFTIIELGRIMLNPGTDWALPWLTSKDQPVLVWFYVGPVIQELSFQLMGQYGPRISGLLGALAAATVMTGWLHARGTSRTASFVLGLVFLLDPLFVQSYTMGRLDGWTMAFCISSCWILHHAALKVGNFKSSRALLILSGFFAGLACFIWPSAVFMFPLVAFEFQYFLKSLRNKSETRWSFIAPLKYWAIGSIGIVIVLLTPIAPLLFTHIDNIITALKANTHKGPHDVHEPFILHITSSVIAMLQSLKFSPLLPILAAISLIQKKEFVLAIALSITALLMLCTIVYLHRVQYLLPYFIVAISCFLTQTKGNKILSEVFISKIKPGILILLLVWASFISLITRQLLALNEKSERSRELVYQAAKNMIGKGEHTVFLPAPEFYYAGRDLGWKMYRPYTGVGDTISLKAFHSIIAHVNNAIMPNWELSEDFKQLLKKEGFQEKGWINLYQMPLVETNTKTTNTTRLRNLYAIFRQPYGPYMLYVRKSALIAKSQIQQ